MISKEQREARRRYVGSSDSPAIVGADPFRTAEDVYWSKVVEVDEKDKPAFEIGNRLESVIVDWCQDKIATKVERDVFITNPSLPHHCANLDGLTVVDGGKVVVEAKYSTEHHLWGADGSDEIPDRVMVQVQHQMGVVGANRALVPALIITPRNAEFRLYAVNANVELATMIFDAGRDFFENHVLKKVPPGESSVPPVEVMKAMKRGAGTLVELPDECFDLIAKWEEAKAAAKAAAKLEDAAYAAVLSQLGENECGIATDGTELRYVLENGAWKVDRERLLAMAPEAFAACVSQGTRRILRVKRPKAAKLAA